MRLFSIAPILLLALLAYAPAPTIANDETVSVSQVEVPSLTVEVSGMYARVRASCGPDGEHCPCCSANVDSCETLPWGTRCKYVSGSGVSYTMVYDCW